MNEETNNYSLWQFLGQYTCVIPVIQRDYAQGRVGRESLRKEFFGQLIEALDTGSSIKLDFVYGCPLSGAGGNTILPLDGQQRLTSMWLLHWYLAYRTGRLADTEISERLKKFSYQTRTSSRDFCERLCSPLTGKQAADETISHYIASQPWFSRRFKADPTVRSMLRSLSDSESGSGFEQLLQGKDCEKLWKRAIGDDSPVTFYFRSTDGIPNPDDLYVKMNARGKKLTEFENFKAELFSFRTQDGRELFRDGTDFIKKFENGWTNLFWPLRHCDRNVIDHIQFEFFKRMVLCRIVAEGNTADPDNKLREHITRHEPFASMEIYRRALDAKFKERFASVMDGIMTLGKNGKELNELFKDPYSLSYLPIYVEDDKQSEMNVFEIREKDEFFRISDITVARLVRFYAASMFFLFTGKSKTEFDPDRFDDWMIFCRNMYGNSGIDDYDGAKAILDLFNRINRYCLNIIDFLSSDDAGRISISGDLLKAQYGEEREKAKMIAKCRSHESVIDYEPLIRGAEKNYPFEGAIRFLFTNAEGKYDWNDFESKKSTFDRVNLRDRLSPLALRALLSKVQNWDELGWLRCNSSSDSWREIMFRKPEFVKYVHQMLAGGVCEERLKEFVSPFGDEVQKGTHEELVRTRFLHQTTWADFYFRPNEHMVLVRRSRAQWKRYLLGTSRNRLLAEGRKRGEILLLDGQWLGDGEHIWGEDFYFELQDRPESRFIFWWHAAEPLRRSRNDPRNQDVYLCLRNGPRDYADKDDPERLAVSVPYGCSYPDFIKELRTLLSKAETASPTDILLGDAV